MAPIRGGDGRRTPTVIADDDDLDAEVRFHLDARTDALIRDGMPPDEAARQARREFGDLDGLRGYVGRLTRRMAHAGRWRNQVAMIPRDIRYAWRSLRRTPAFTVTAALTIALGIGGSAAIFSVVNSVVWRPLPFPDPDRLYAVYSANRSADLLRAAVSPVDLDDWRARRDRIADLGGYWYAEGNSGVNLTGRGAPRRLSSVFVERGFLSTLGVEPVHGRLPREDELSRGGPHDVVLLSHGFWTREFGADPAVVGRALTLNERPFTVIGVLPVSMTYPAETADVFVPYAVIPDQSIPRIRQVRVLNVVARAKPGVSIDGVRAEMAALTASLAREYPENAAWGAATVEPLHDIVIGSVRDGLFVLSGAVALMWVLVCVNVASLQLARAFGRVRELAVRTALGAARSQIVRQLLIESLTLATVGGALGLALAYGATHGLVALASGQLPRSSEVAVDGAVLGFAVVLSMLTGLVFGIVPALRATQRNAAAGALREAGRGTLGLGHRRWRVGLIVAEVAVAMMLVVGAGLMGRSFLALTRVDIGFDPDGLLAVQFTIDPNRYGPRDESPGAPAPYIGIYQRIIERVRAVPGVTEAAAVKDPPYRGNGERVSFRVPDRPVPPGEDPPTAIAIHVSDGYFATLRAPLRQGREFTSLDRAGTPMVVVVNEAFARRVFPGHSAVDRSLLLGGGVPARIIGVVGDIRQVSVATPAVPTLYLHNLQNSRVKTTIVARTEGDPASLADAIRHAIWSVEPAQPITAAFTFDESVDRALARPRLLTVLIGGFGVMGVALGALGIYGLLASTVGERRREIGVRLALGARPKQVLSAVMWSGLAVTTTGLVIGLAGAWALSRFLEAVLYGVEPVDPATFAGTSLLLLAVAGLASWIPARRAAAVPPIEALRD